MQGEGKLGDQAPHVIGGNRKAFGRDGGWDRQLQQSVGPSLLA